MWVGWGVEGIGRGLIGSEGGYVGWVGVEGIGESVRENY